MSRKFGFYLDKAYLEGIKLHSLRHTFRMNLISQGVDIYTVSRLLGHSDIRTSLIYAKTRVDVAILAGDTNVAFVLTLGQQKGIFVHTKPSDAPSISTNRSAIMPLIPSSRISFPFNRRKALAVAEYFLKRLGGEANYMYLLKLIFFADRYHIRKYLRPVTTDTYFAMKNGPVASWLYDVFKGQAKGVKSIKRSEDNKYFIVLATNDIKEDELSSSDVEAIEFSLKNFGFFSENQLANITHAYPEWSKYCTKSGRDEMFYEDFLRNAKAGNAIFKRFHIQDPFEPIPAEEREELVEEIIEYCSQAA